MIANLIKNLHQGSGVYLFKDSSEVVLYVGKSIAVQERIKSHFAATGEKSKSMISQSKKIEVIPVETELEALLLEASLIKKYLPRYNSSAKDDKSPLYICITKDDLPIVKVSRKTETLNSLAFGPFPSSRIVKNVLRQLRKIFPYHSTQKLGKKACLYSHMGLCDPCPCLIVQTSNLVIKNKLIKKYKNNIKGIVRLLNSKSKFVKRQLTKKMEIASRKQDFEGAAKLRDQISNLEYIIIPFKKPNEYLKNMHLLEDQRSEELQKLYEILSPRITNLHFPERIECFDNSHTGGTNITSSMVTFINGEPSKNYYRHFKIRKTKSFDDYSSINEVLTRRFNHLKDWGTPNLILIDGGKGQVSAAKNAMRQGNIDLPLIGLAKRLEEIIIPNSQGEFTIIKLQEDNPALHLLQRLRDESHRFARRLHIKLRLENLTK